MIWFTPMLCRVIILISLKWNAVTAGAVVARVRVRDIVMKALNAHTFAVASSVSVKYSEGVHKRIGAHTTQIHIKSVVTFHIFFLSSDKKAHSPSSTWFVSCNAFNIQNFMAYTNFSIQGRDPPHERILWFFPQVRKSFFLKKVSSKLRYQPLHKISYFVELVCILQIFVLNRFFI